MTVFVDLITAVLVGVFVANLITVDRLTNIQLDSVRLTDGKKDADSSSPMDQLLKRYQGAALLLCLEGPLSFGVGRGLRKRLTGFASHQIMIIDLTRAHLVGVSTALILDELIREELNQDRKVMLVGMSEKANANLSRMGSIEAVGSDWIIPNIEDAMKRVGILLNNSLEKAGKNK